MGSNPTSPTNFNATVAQMEEAIRLERIQCGFKSHRWYQINGRVSRVRTSGDCLENRGPTGVGVRVRVPVLPPNKRRVIARKSHEFINCKLFGDVCISFNKYIKGDIMKKVCSTCKQEKDITEFRKNSHKKDGLQVKCISCDKDYAKFYYNQNKEHCIKRSKRNTKMFANKFQTYKDTLYCIKCGENDNFCLDFHHLDSEEKEKEVSSLVKYGNWKNLMEEISKCVVLCKNCHVKTHRYGLDNF